MPIIISDFNWKQSKEKLTIQVPLHKVPPNKADIFTSPQYIKATFDSFFFEVLLSHPVDILQSSCLKTSDFIIFDLKKVSEEIWESLELDNLSKEEKRALKIKLIDEEHKRIQQACAENRSKKSELKRVAINEQIQLDTRTRNQIEDIKKSEEKKALGDINEWKNSQEATRKLVVNKNQTKVQENRKNTKIAHSAKSTEVPKPRNVHSLQILFTPRQLPTPSRESRLEEENQFLAKQAEARRASGFVDDDLRPEEKNPQYLLAKGQEFMKSKNYLGAISAFSFGIKLNPNFVDLYFYRSEAHIAIGNFKRTVEDCTSALKLYKPPSGINLRERAICLGRRGIGLYELGFLKQGLSELEASVKLNKQSEFSNILDEYRKQYEEKLQTESESEKCS